MAKYRKKPVVIDAVQFDDVPCHDPPGVFRRPEDNTPYVVTIHGQRCYISPGDWIVAEPDGVHYYPIKPDIFEATYVPAGEMTAEEADAAYEAAEPVPISDDEVERLVRVATGKDSTP